MFASEEANARAVLCSRRPAPQNLLRIIALAAVSAFAAHASGIVEAAASAGGAIQNNNLFSLDWQAILDHATRANSGGFFDPGTPALTSANDISVYACRDAGCTTGSQLISAGPSTSQVSLFDYQDLSAPVVMTRDTHVLAR